MNMSNVTFPLAAWCVPPTPIIDLMLQSVSEMLLFANAVLRNVSLIHDTVAPESHKA